MEKITYTLAEVSDMTGWTQESIRRGCHADRYQHIRHGRRYFMTAAQVEAMVASEQRGGDQVKPPTRREARVAEIEAARQFHLRRMRGRGAA